MKARVSPHEPGEKFESYVENSLESMNKWGERVSNGLIFGNAGAAVIAGGKFLDLLDKPDYAAILLPSCWLFTTGLILAGLSPFLAWTSHMVRYNVAADMAENTALKEPPNWALYYAGISSRCQLALEVVAAILFVLGLTVPLVLASQGYDLLIG